MSEGNGVNSGIPNADSENVLDDLMQNNVQFDEDEKPKTVSFQLKMQGRRIKFYTGKTTPMSRACVRILEPRVPSSIVVGIICHPCCFE